MGRGIPLSAVVGSVLVALWTPTARAATPAEIADKWAGSVVLIKVLDEKNSEVRTGSGFMIGPGLVATCYHVVAGGVVAQVKTSDRIVYPVTGVLAFDRDRDLAILTVNRLDYLPPVDLGDSSLTKPGEPVVAMGSPLGLEGSVTEGIVSRLREVEGYGEVLQVSAPISPGNSGGPLFDSEGRVIGVVSFYFVGGQNVNFGIPVNALKDLMTRTEQTVTDVGELRQSQQELLTEIGILPPRRVRIQLRVPKEPPHTLAPFPSHPYDVATLQVWAGEEPLERVTSEQEMAPNRFFVSTLGVLRFDAAQKDKPVTVDLEYRPYRVAVFIETDATGGDLAKIFKDRVPKLADEVVIGADVDAAVAEWRQQGQQTMRDLARYLDCARLIIAGLDASMSDSGYTIYGPTQYSIVTTVRIQLYDLNTGRQLFAQSAVNSGSVGQLAGYRHFRRQLAETCVDRILGVPAQPLTRAPLPPGWGG